MTNSRLRVDERLDARIIVLKLASVNVEDMSEASFDDSGLDPIGEHNPRLVLVSKTIRQFTSKRSIQLGRSMP